MPKIKATLSQRTIDLLEELKQQYRLPSRSFALELIIEQGLDNLKRRDFDSEE